MNNAAKVTASVRVLRSYDYCHFEVQLSSNDIVTLDEVNDLRKQAAILCDEAVRQYKIAKEKERSRESNEYDRERIIRQLAAIKAKPESELAPDEMALLKASAEKDFWKSYNQDDFCYQDDPERDFHFSMLRKFKDSRVLG